MSDNSGQVGASGASKRNQIAARNLSKVFISGGESVLALSDTNLEIKEGTFVSLIGPSGCGKSTLLRIMGGLDKPSSGEVVGPSDVISGDGTALKSAFVFQEYGLFPWLNAIDNVAFGLRMSGVGKSDRTERARHWLSRVGLSGFDKAYPEQLSGGMRQRLSLARAFVTEPDVLFMDEPMGAVDPQTRLLLQEDLIRLWEETRKTVLLVTHSIDEAILLGDRVVVMTARPGRIKLDIEVGIPRPRTVSTTSGSAFGELREILWNNLRNEVEQSLEFT